MDSRKNQLANFDKSKKELLDGLQDGIDFSPKGSIDFPVRDTVNLINSHENYVTTSSCSGRISVYELGEASKGINWLLVRHEVVTLEEVTAAITKAWSKETSTGLCEGGSSPMVMLKCEPFILHVHCRDVESARELHQLAYSCGYRESGISLGQKKVMVAVRTTGFSLEMPIGNNGQFLMDSHALDIMIREANDRLRKNFARIDKFLRLLKASWQWPKLAFEGTIESSTTRRFGHASCGLTAPSLPGMDRIIALIGGNAAVSTSTASKADMSSSSSPLSSLSLSSTTRNTPTNLLTFTSSTTSVVNASSSRTESIDTPRVHAACCRWTVSKAMSLIIVSGGRKGGPAGPLLSCCQIMRANSSGILQEMCCEVVSNGTAAPEPRFGHSFTRLSEDGASCGVFCLIGGRNATKLLNDCYLLITRIVPSAKETSEIAVTVSVEWIRIELHNNISAVCFHASSAVSTYFSASEYQSNSYLLSPFSSSSPQPNLKDLLHDSLEFDAVVIHGGLLSLSDPVSDGQFTVIYPLIGVVSKLGALPVHSPIKTSDVLEIESNGNNHSNSSSTNNNILYYSRFGHTLTSLGGRSFLLLGGQSFDSLSASSSSDSSSSSSTLLLHISSDDSGSLLGQLTPITEIINTTTNDAVATGLPCEICRVHHTVDFDETTHLVRAIGGGSICLSFGTHLCDSIALSCRFGNSSKSDSTMQKRNDNNFSNRSVDPATKAAPIANKKAVGNVSTTGTSNSISNRESLDSTSTIVFLIEANYVKSIKSLFEQHNVIEKSKRITRVDESISNIRILNLSTMDSNPCNSSDEMVSMDKLMAVPINDALNSFLSRSLANSSSSSANAVVSNHTYSDLFEEVVQTIHSETILIGQQNVRENKLLVVSTFRQAQNYLKQYAVDHKLPLSSSILPNKFELVGDVLMISEGCLDSGGWERFLDENTISLSDVVAFWSGLAQCFKVQRIARKAIIDSGEMRESKVRLLLPPVGRDPQTGPNSIGWVTVLENNIKFSFDITRVMFCSGNVTERMRMGRQATKDQVIVDLYTGIGYYTVPFLVHGKAKHVYACEWNPNSILALRQNLLQNKVSPDRFTIFEGDNAISAMSPTLTSIADRISLGLLPSSVKGWPLAVNCLKPTGGIIHLHENVMVSSIEDFSASVIQKFEEMFATSQKPMKVTVQHTEIVKNYAPRVVHLVLDLLCTPIP